MAVATISRRDLLFGRGAPEPERIYPPGVTPEGLAACTGCGRCVEACPAHIISLSDNRPSLDFSVGECTFCGECRSACPEPVFQLADAACFPHVAAIAGHCLAKNNVACQACRDSCPELAIRFPPRVGGPFLPIVDEDACSGCGACVGICPVGAVHVSARHQEGANA
ncbi:ferredoxin-type protein NapF [Ensifer sp. IC4062]|nr:ferredoxin-type protein NapF [Ensifer sp. IC4062]MCA1441392.1 ferredoxin-type protein NapF [Ensifer sp. IC4062]